MLQNIKNASLNKKVFFVSAIFFLLIGIVGFCIALNHAQKIASNLAKARVLEQAELYRAKINATIEFDIKIFTKITKSKLLNEFLTNESDKEDRQATFELFNDSLDLTKFDSWFIASNKTYNYYFNNKDMQFNKHELISKLSKKDPRDKWFFYSLEANESYILNMGLNKTLAETKLWINVPIYNNGIKIGVAGGGINYEMLVNNHLSTHNGIISILTDSNGSIFLSSDKKNQTFDFKITDAAKRASIFGIFNQDCDKEDIKQNLKLIESGKNDSFVFEEYINGEKYSIAAIYIPNINLIAMSMIKIDSVFSAKELAVPIGIFVLLIAICSVIIYFLINKKFIKPINSISNVANKIASGEYFARVNIYIDQNDEIGKLCKNINHMAHKIENFAKSSEERYRWITENSHDIIWAMDLKGNFTYVSPAVNEIMGYSQQEIIELNIANTTCNNFKTTMLDLMREMINESQFNKGTISKTIEIELKHKIKGCFWAELTCKLTLENSKAKLFIGSIRDISERVKAQNEIKRLAFSDTLTGLANRQAMLDSIEKSLENLSNDKQFAGLIYLDMNNFKHLNDTHGHKAGDELLIEVGNRLKSFKEEIDCVARFGGDEFVLLVNNLDSDIDIAKDTMNILANQISNKLSQIYILTSVKYSSSASIGYKIFDFNDEVDAILHAADQAMYISKKQKKAIQA